MKFQFEGYIYEDDTKDYLEIDFNFVEKSEFIKALDPDVSIPILIPEKFPKYQIDLFKELLEKITNNTLDDDDNNLLHSKLLKPILDYFIIEIEDFSTKINFIDETKRYDLTYWKENFPKRKIKHVIFEIKNRNFELVFGTTITYNYAYLSITPKDELIYFGKGNYVSINEINELITSLIEKTNIYKVFGIVGKSEDKIEHLVFRTVDGVLYIEKKYSKGFYEKRNIFELNVKVYQPIKFLNSLKNKIIEFIDEKIDE